MGYDVKSLPAQGSQELGTVCSGAPGVRSLPHLCESATSAEQLLRVREYIDYQRTILDQIEAVIAGSNLQAGREITNLLIQQCQSSMQFRDELYAVAFSVPAISITDCSENAEGILTNGGENYIGINRSRRHKMQAGHHCHNCKCTVTPQWRFIATSRYCNACYMRYKRSVGGGRFRSLLPALSLDHPPFPSNPCIPTSSEMRLSESEEPEHHDSGHRPHNRETSSQFWNCESGAPYVCSVAEDSSSHQWPLAF
eukprot:Gregarina_sp_Poly_1__4945@NODE_261_length_10458_cov_187_060244_g228_i0_p5_GENE_NODE_261_length_10458_cov_187_060244_g228_i0NODE_261_length_10458_cov_187_060244_g228_i0_p5_ORF_typecomplete_len254_score9_21GATA/PF00320_27/2e05_NODE_261_length_10458_cov_187_060244_g228_i081798940